MATKCMTFLLIFLIFLGGFSSVLASPPARIVAGIVTNVVSTVFKWLWSLRTQIKTEKAITSRSSIKFQGGYTVETVFDGSKAGIEPYSVQTSPAGDLLILDSANSNLYRVSTHYPDSDSRPKIVAGSPEGFTGHVDGKLREARMCHPKGIAVDDSGNIYIADTLNMAIRKISDAGITTIAGGKWSHGDSLSEEAKLSDDFDIVYMRSSCSLLVTDRGNQVIKEIQLHDDDCSYEPHQVQPVEHDENLHLGIAVLGAAIFFGYMLALLKQRVQSLFSSNRVNPSSTDFLPHIYIIMTPVPQLETHSHLSLLSSSFKPGPRSSAEQQSCNRTPYQMTPKSVRPPLIPDQDNEDEYEDDDEGLFFSFGRLIVNASSAVAELFTGFLFSGFRKKRPRHQNLQHFQHLSRHPSYTWPNMQETYALRGEDEPPPPLEPRSRTPHNVRKAYENAQQQFRQSGRAYYEEPVQHQRQIQQKQQHPRQREALGNSKNSEEKGTDKSEIVFGAVQEQDGRREAMVIKAVDFSDPVYSQHNIGPRLNYMGYSSYSYS